jgi:hypothetical protein
MVAFDLLIPVLTQRERTETDRADDQPEYGLLSALADTMDAPGPVWGSRGRGFKSRRPDHEVAGQGPLHQHGEVASRSFDRTLTAGFCGILRHVAFTKSGERHIPAVPQ